MHHPLPTLSATRMAAMIRAQETTPTDLLEAHFEQVDKVNPAINAVIWQDRDAARQHAGTLDAEARAGTYRGPLHGVPITVKEAFDLPGSPSTWGNPKLAENFPDAPALVVQRYRDAGANIFGKTNVPLDLGDWQSFNKIYGTTNNPWDVTRTPGGSSGGSAAALATGMAALEAGSDIGSSIRNPAHYCGVFGLKPTHGVIPLQGHAPPGFTGDIDIAVTGPMARAAEDLQMGFDILLGADDLRCNAWRPDCPPDPRTKLSEFRVGVMLGDDISPVATSYLDALQTFSEALEKAGATVTYETRPHVDSEEHFVLYMRLLGAAMAFGHDEASAANMASIASALPHGRHREMQLARLEGVRASHRDWQMLDNERRRARAKFDAYFAEWDILIAPVCASAAFVQDEHPVRAQRNLMINGQAQPEALQLFWSGYSGVVELPSVVGPAGFDAGLPVGYQAIAGYGRDRTALAFASAVEREIIGFTPPPAYR